MRLKIMREASQWADILRAAGVSADHLMQSPLNWERDLSEMVRLRDQALSQLE
jgi:hypothetical protein